MTKKLKRKKANTKGHKKVVKDIERECACVGGTDNVCGQCVCVRARESQLHM
jgi:hypothetical protein